jgi:hypothetical protein
VPNNVWGWGSLDAFAAVETAAIGRLEGTVTAAGDGAPIEGAQITAQPGILLDRGGEAVTDFSGFYTMTLLTGTYTVTVRGDGFFPQMLADVHVASGGITIQDFELAPSRCLYWPLIFKEQ